MKKVLAIATSRIVTVAMGNTFISFTQVLINVRHSLFIQDFAFICNYFSIFKINASTIKIIFGQSFWHVI